MKDYTPPKTTEVTVSRTVAAAPADVYDVWMDSKSTGGPWFGAQKLIFDGKVDGLFFFSAENEGKAWPHYGRFVVLERGKRIQHTWVSEATRGLESVVTITFEPQGDKTLVTLHHAGIPDDPFGRQHKDGWDWVLGTVADKIASR